MMPIADSVGCETNAVRSRTTSSTNTCLGGYPVVTSYGAVQFVGMSMPVVGAILAACGSTKSGAPTTTSTANGTTGKIKRGGTLRIALVLPTGVIDPVRIC